MAGTGTILAVLIPCGGGYSGRVQAQPIVGVAHVLDGDTIDIAQERTRLHGIDAAEEDQRCRAASGGAWDCAQVATARLRALIGSGQAACEPVGRDKYDRILALCRADGVDVQEVLVGEGLTWAYRQYSRDYIAAEDAARMEGRGIWQAPTEPPWEWRRRKRLSGPAAASNRSASSGCAIKGNINSEGERIYHTPASPWYERTTVNESLGRDGSARKRRPGRQDGARHDGSCA